MCSSLSGDESRIKVLLAGNEDDVAAGLNWVDQNYRYKICGLLRRRFPGLLPEDLPEVWQDSLVSLYRMTSQGTFERDGALDGLVWTLAMRRAQDRLRRNASWYHPIDARMQEMREPQSLERWQALDAMQRRELVELICESITRLPPRQNLVWRTYVTHYPDSERLDFLTDEVRKVLQQSRADAADQDPDKSLSKKAVSQALYAGREKIREDLKRKGYEL